ncbi:hypothetical protein Vadar_030513 [Vaccinium darrowii]|uniref:Uncharacterized protein n=1 Tax=Vaccinium darrowii TaxID=229202 RepID=A0ACB7YA66_9ERIC|nr:hypothetical protein Vadar_030513 [Vaccinium darrowii]
MIWDTCRTTYNSSKTAVLDSSGHFISSDNLNISSADFGFGPQRRLTLDIDGNLRLYSLKETTGNWTVTWQAMSNPCRVHGLCGPNSICSYGSGAGTGRGCFCVPGYRIKNSSDWSYGCELDPSYLSGDAQTTDFVSLSDMELYGYEYDVFKNQTLESCKEKCLKSAICKGFLFKNEDGAYNCYAKSQLLNGKTSPNLLGTLYVKLNVSQKEKNGFIPSVQQIQLNCSGKNPIVLDRIYKTKSGSKFLEYLAWFAGGVGLLEMLCVFMLCFLVFRTPKDSGPETRGYFLAATTFKKFSYAELKKATRGFNKEIGRGGYGVVYKGTLLDNRVAAIKRLNDAKEGEAEFLAEVSTIGKLNHMNLIEMWGYCVEGKHRLLVSEFMEHGSLADNLNSNTLDCEKRYSIAVGIAKGLSYLHEECLEWVLHCDIKPQNILLDANYQPKVADFGLSKLLNRGEGSNLSFSKMRGTRGYMAPEWVFNHLITSKVDVYSYGIVVFEMITGRSPAGVQPTTDGGGLLTWVRNKKQGAPNSNAWIEEIIDPTLRGGYEMGRMETLVRVAMQCVEDDKDARPTMRKVVEMLLWNEDSLI